MPPGVTGLCSAKQKIPGVLSSLQILPGEDMPAAAENNRETMTISQEAMEILTQYPWPGNIRELRNCIERMVVLSHENHLDINDVPRNIRDASGGANTMIQVNGDTIDDHEKALILKTLDECGGNRTLAAKKLGISRRTLYRRLDEYNM